MVVESSQNVDVKVQVPLYLNFESRLEKYFLEKIVAFHGENVTLKTISFKVHVHFVPGR